MRGRRPLAGQPCARPRAASTSRWAGLLEGAIRDGVEAGTFQCADPTGAAWRILSVVDGLALQVVAHETIVDRQHMLAWAATATERELGMPAGTFTIAATNGATPPRA